MRCIIFLISLIPVILSVPISEFFPFGNSAGDQILAPNDDYTTGPLPLTSDFPYFDNNHRQIFLSNNGLFSFLGPISSYQPNPFPMEFNMRLVAGFWSDIDTRGPIPGGNAVFYHVYPESSNINVFQKARSYIQRFYPLYGGFNPKIVITGTWYKVGAFESQTSRTNTFQIVLTSDGIRSFVFLLYHDLQWSTPSETSDAVGGQAGFNAGDGVNFEMLPYSRTKQAVLLTNISNVNIPGLFVFRVDSETIVGSGCSNTVLATFRPKQGTQLGSTPITIQGPCFQQYQPGDIKCRFGETEVVDAIIFNNNKAICLTPFSRKATPVFVYFSFDGGAKFQPSWSTFSYTPAGYGVNAYENVEPEVNVIHENGVILSINSNVQLDWYLSDARITDWSGIRIQFSTEMCLVTQRASNEELLLTTCIPLSRGIQPQAGYQIEYIRVPSISSTNSIQTVFFRAVATDQSNSKIHMVLNSAIYIIQTSLSSTQLSCNTWFNQQPQPMIWNQNLLFCPLTIAQARVARCCYEPDPVCNENGNRNSYNCALRRGQQEKGELTAVACYISRSINNNGAGTECCYDRVGQLITHGRGAGTDNRFGPSQYPIRHFFEDTLPFVACCYDGSSDIDCAKHFQARPTRRGSSTPITGGGTWGDPHFTTFDGFGYTFNGYGEYTYLAILNSDRSSKVSFREVKDSLKFESQIRTVPSVTTTTRVNLATVIRGFSGKSNDASSEPISVTLSRRQLLIVQRGNETIDLDPLDDDPIFNNQSLTLYYPEMTIEYNRVNRMLTLNWFIGVSVRVEQTLLTTAQSNIRVLNVGVSLSGSFKNRTLGLLGVYDDDKSNDLQASNGKVIANIQNVTLQQIHSDFGQTWLIDPDRSLFRYESYESAMFYYNESLQYQPRFNLPTLSATALNYTKRLCNISNSTPVQSQWSEAQRTCFYDFAATNDENLALASKRAANEHEQQRIAQRDPPTFNINLPLDLAVFDGAPVNLYFIASSVYGNRVSYRLVRGPTTALFNQSTGQFYWRANQAEGENVMIRVTATDTVYNLVSSHELLIRVDRQTTTIQTSTKSVSSITSTEIKTTPSVVVSSSTRANTLTNSTMRTIGSTNSVVASSSTRANTVTTSTKRTLGSTNSVVASSPTSTTRSKTTTASIARALSPGASMCIFIIVFLFTFPVIN